MDRRQQKRPRDGREPSGGPPGKRGPGLAPGEFTNDPSTIASRIFVGSLPEDISREELKEHFSQWGNIQSVSITKNKFGFVQYETAEEAEFCLSHGYTTMIKGQKVDVKPAKIGSGGSNAPPSGGSGFRSAPPPRGGPSRGGSDYYPEDPYAREGRIEEYGSGRYADDYYRDPYERERLPPPPPTPRDNGFFRGEERPPLPRPYASSVYPATEAAVADPLEHSRPNDVEIVVPSKMQRGFAESIEGELKRLQMKVDLLFPPPEVSPTQVIQDLTSRKCLFALFATGENEKHRSVTVNILYGAQQEHRNMPVEDALRLIQQHFDEYVKKSRLRNMREVVPRDVRNLLLDLLEMRPLSMGDLDKVIKYLRERQNALVDDQIEQKRENAAGSKAAVGVGNLAVAYPGYNYITGPSGTITGASGIAAQAVSLVPATSAAGFPQVAYGTSQGVVGYGLAAQASAPQLAPLLSGRNDVQPDRYIQLPKNTQDGQQDRYMQMQKSGQGIPLAPVGVPAPLGVPAPQTAGGQGASRWNANQPPKMDASGQMWGNPPLKMGQQSPKPQTKSYNPWVPLM